MEEKSDLEKVALYSSDKELRIEAIKSLDPTRYEKTLGYIANYCSDKELRIYAIKRLGKRI